MYNVNRLFLYKKQLQNTLHTKSVGVVGFASKPPNGGLGNFFSIFDVVDLPKIYLLTCTVVVRRPIQTASRILSTPGVLPNEISSKLKTSIESKKNPTFLQKVIM